MPQGERKKDIRKGQAQQDRVIKEVIHEHLPYSQQSDEEEQDETLESE